MTLILDKLRKYCLQGVIKLCLLSSMKLTYLGTMQYFLGEG